MYRLLIKDNKKRKNFLNYECRRQVLVYLLCRTLAFSGLTIRFNWAEQLYKRRIQGQYGSSNMRNRCLVTSRGRSIFRSFRLSRHEFKRQASKGLLTGVRKFSW